MDRLMRRQSRYSASGRRKLWSIMQNPEKRFCLREK